MRHPGQRLLACFALIGMWGCHDTANVTGPEVPAVDAFVEMARTTGCTDLANQLFVIDQRRVFWHTRASCVDGGSFRNELFGLVPADLLCSYDGSIATPRVSCASDEDLPMFETILAHPDDPSLGLGSGRVVQVSF